MNDFNVRKYDYRQYLDLFSVVFQDYSLLALPLGNNVSSAASWDGEKAERCLREVGFGERYAEMAKGLETPIYKILTMKALTYRGAKHKRSLLPEHSIRTLPLSFSTSLPPHSILLPRQRYTLSLMKLSVIKQLFTSAIVCPPVVSATRSLYLTMARSFKSVHTRNC